MLLSLATVTAILQLAIATNVSPPILYARQAAQDGSLEKRETCADGGQCLFGSCCGDGCALNCCALDNGGLGCGIAERCQFRGNVFVGCCGNFLGGCTGEATRVTVHTPYSTVTLGAATDAMTTSTATTTREEVFTAISVTTPTATAAATGTTTTTTSSESQGSSSHSHRVSASSTSVKAETTSSSHRSTTTTAVVSQASPSPNNGGASGMGVEVPVLAGMAALGAVLL